MAISKLVVLGVVSLATVVSADRAGLKCKNDVCGSNLKLKDQTLGTSFAVPKGSDASGAIATATGPGVFIIRDLDQTCDCSVQLPSLNKTIQCKNPADIGNGVELPAGETEVKFVGSAALGCFKALGEVTPPVEEVVKVLEASSAGKSPPSQIIQSASSAGVKSFEAHEAEKPKFKGFADNICDRMSHGVQMVVLQELPDNTHSKEIQLFMSHMSEIFDDFKAGLSYFGGEGECFREAVPLGYFPDPVQADFSTAMKFAATSSAVKPQGAPLTALKAAAEMIDWETPAEGKEVLRIILLDASTAPLDETYECGGADPKAVAKALADRGISVIFFVTPETKDAFVDFKQKQNMAGYVHVLKTGKSMLSVNNLTLKVKDSLKKMCAGEGERLLL